MTTTMTINWIAAREIATETRTVLVISCASNGKFARILFAQPYSCSCLNVNFCWEHDLDTQPTALSTLTVMILPRFQVAIKKVQRIETTVSGRATKRKRTISWAAAMEIATMTVTVLMISSASNGKFACVLFAHIGSPFHFSCSIGAFPVFDI